MKCPVDNATLLITDRSGIEIDYCPDCRGVWLDRGELDKIIERADTVSPPSTQSTYSSPQNDYRQENNSNYNDHNNPHYKKKRKESFLGDIFDF